MIVIAYSVSFLGSYSANLFRRRLCAEGLKPEENVFWSCMFVCISVRIYVISLYVCLHVCMSVCIHVPCMHVCMFFFISDDAKILTSRTVVFKIIHTIVDSSYISSFCQNQNTLRSSFMAYDWPTVDWITITYNYGNIQFQGYVIHSHTIVMLFIVMFKIIHIPAHRFRLVEDSIFFVLHDCFYSIPIGAHNLPIHFLWELGPFFFGSRLKLGQAGWFPGHHLGFQVLPSISMGFTPGLRLCHSRILISFSLSNFWTTSAVCFGNTSGCWMKTWRNLQRSSNSGDYWKLQ